MKVIGQRDGEHRGWPAYLLGGRMRTSTVVLVIAFLATWWVYYTYQPQPVPPAPTTQVVPPGFVPDPEYTWVPRTYVQTRPRTTELTTTTETTEPSEPTGTTTPGPDESTTSGVPTTVIDPDGAGPMPPTTVTETTAPTSVSTVPNRSGTPTAPTTTAGAGPGPTPATPPPAQ